MGPLQKRGARWVVLMEGESFLSGDPGVTPLGIILGAAARG